MKNGKLMAGLMIGATAGGMVGAVMDKKNSQTVVTKMSKKMLKKCIGVMSDLL